MVSGKIFSAAALFALAVAQNNDNNNNNNNNNQQAADSTQLLPNAIQTGSFFDGSESLGAEDGQAKSDTSQNNFINLCAGQTITNGLQIITGSCSPTPQGFIPAKDKMISTIILFPSNDQTIESGKDFTIQVQVNGLQAGSFTNAQATYYSAPQALNGGGNVIGHTHVTVQDLGNSLNPKSPPDPTQFAFFKGINDAGNGNGLLTADVVGGLPEGNYRICTLTSASNHQPVIMPVAQRGSQDDCTKFVVNGNNNTINAAANNGDKGEAAADLAASAVALGPGALTATAAGAQATADANANANANQNQNQGQDQNNAAADANNQNQQGQNQGNANANANNQNQGQQGQNQAQNQQGQNQAQNQQGQNQAQNQQGQNQAQNQQQGQNQGQNQAQNQQGQNQAQNQGNANAANGNNQQRRSRLPARVFVA